ncbi:MAG: hypothetical protein WC673_02110 [Candidatus Paceibacterota bacterium]|jgi:hypothetical protein
MNGVTSDNLVNIIRKTLLESLQGILTDPDQGLELRPEIKRRLKKYSLAKSFRSHPLSEIKKKYA